MTSPTTEMPAKREYKLHKEAEVDSFIEEYKILSKLFIPIEIPDTIKAKEIIHKAAQILNTQVIEIDTEEIQDTSTLMEQVHIEEKEIIYRPGILAQAIKNNHWLIINTKDKETPLTNYITELYSEEGKKNRVSPTENTAKTLDTSARRSEYLTDQPQAVFQVFFCTPLEVHKSTCTRGSSYALQIASTEKQEEFIKRIATALTTTQKENTKKHSTSTSTITALSIESLLTTILRAMGTYFLGTEDIKEVQESISNNSYVYHTFAMILDRLDSLGTLDPNGPLSEARSKVFIILRDVLLARQREEEREQAEQALMHLLCVTEEQVLSYESPLQREYVAPLTEEKEYTLTRSATRLISFVLSQTETCNSFLLIGETGTGKTTTIQKIFEKRNQLNTIGIRHRQARKFICINLSKDTDISDLLGGYQFASIDQCTMHLNDIIQGYFQDFFIPEKNEELLHHLDTHTINGQLPVVQQTARDILQKFKEVLTKSTVSQASQIPQISTNEISNAIVQRRLTAINLLEKTLSVIDRLEQGAQNICVFVEGPLTRAMHYGYWILLDESNLAPEATVKYLSAVIERKQITLLEDSGHTISIDPRTLIFQCINPGDDYGKKDIQMSRTLTAWVDEPDKHPEDIHKIATAYQRTQTPEEIQKIVQFYIEIKEQSRIHSLRTGGNRTALFGIRNLIRTIQMNTTPIPMSIQINFLTQLCIQHKAIGYKLLAQIFPESISKHSQTEYPSTAKYIVTPQSLEYIKEIEASMQSGTAVLLEGNTSVGKTSLINYLAQRHNKKVIRINNHEHTDITEYLGAYGVSTETQTTKEETAEDLPNNKRQCPEPIQPEDNTSSKFIYKEGALVTAVREGHWVLLDELNLAPTEVLESLNRLLDSNKEIYIPATQETVKAHKDFVLFATQNPSESSDYKNRKHLSKAFRNRFIEMFIEDKTEKDLETILLGMKLGKVYTKTLITIYESLRILSSNRPYGYITLREMMKIIKRFTGKEPSFIDTHETNEQKLFFYTMIILTEKLRTPAEKERVEEIIIRSCKNILKQPFSKQHYLEALSVPIEESAAMPLLTPGVTRILRKMEAAWISHENILLIGPPGLGKTYLSEYVSSTMNTPSIVIGMHAGIELSDFIGGYKEIRTKTSTRFEWQDGPLIRAITEGTALIIDEINLVPDSVLESLNELFDDRSIRVHETKKQYKAHPQFRIIGTMNPGDDYGKREIGKSISSRFTVIYIDQLENNEEAVKYLQYYSQKYEVHQHYTAIQVYRAFHKAAAQTGYQIKSARETELLARYISRHPLLAIQPEPNTPNTQTAISHLQSIITSGIFLIGNLSENDLSTENKTSNRDQLKITETDTLFGIEPFMLQKSSQIDKIERRSKYKYSFTPPTVLQSFHRILQALVCGFNILLEGPPGTGKTKMIIELGKKLNRRVTRLNLSNETEIADLAGRTAPTENGLLFIEGEFIRAIRRGDWIIIDEINLATQSVIEGLNGCLDYRREIFVPELGRVPLHPETIIFGTMNPKIDRLDGRKMLPKSFLSRFIRIIRGPLTETDLSEILSSLDTPYPNQSEIISNLLQLKTEYPINIRDCLRYMTIGSTALVPYQHHMHIDTKSSPPKEIHPYDYITASKITTPEEWHKEITADPRASLASVPSGSRDLSPNTRVFYSGTSEGLYIGHAFLKCNLSLDPSYVIIPGNLPGIEALIHGINHSWPCIIQGPIGKTRLVEFVSTITNRPVYTIACHKDMEASDFLGRYTKAPATHHTPFIWEDSEFVRAIETGTVILLKNINLVRNDVVDRLNSLFEVDGTLEIHEKSGATPRIVTTHANTRFILTVAEGAKRLSPALVNRSMVCSLSSTLSSVDLAKMLDLTTYRPDTDQTESHTLTDTRTLSTAPLPQYTIVPGLLHTHLLSRRLLGYDLFTERSIHPLLPDTTALRREMPLINYLINDQIVQHIISLSSTPLDKEVSEIVFYSRNKEQALEDLLHRLAEQEIEEKYRALYHKQEEYIRLKQMYFSCAEYSTKAPTTRKTSISTTAPKSTCASLNQMVEGFEELKRCLESNESALRVYFEAMDIPLLNRKDISLRIARIKVLEALVNPSSPLCTLANLVSAQRLAHILDTLPHALEMKISQLENLPPALELFTSLLNECTRENIDPLIFLEIQQIEKTLRNKINKSIRRAIQRYSLYKYGSETEQKTVSLYTPPTQGIEIETAASIRERRTKRNFIKFASYLQGIIRSLSESSHPESFAFSIIRKDMSKYSDLWDCFTYSVLKSAIERIALKEQFIQVHPIGKALLSCIPALQDQLLAQEGPGTPSTFSERCKNSLKAIVDYLTANQLSFLSLSPLHSRVVRVLWNAYSNTPVAKEEIAELCSDVCIEIGLFSVYESFSDTGVPCLIDSTISESISLSTKLTPKGLDLSITEENHSPKVLVSEALVHQILTAQTEIEAKKNLITISNAQFDWGDADGAKAFLLEQSRDILALPLTHPLQKIALKLDQLNANSIHINYLSTPLNTARMMIYKGYANIQCYNTQMYTEIHSGWLLHLFNAYISKLDLRTHMLAVEEFLLQSTIGDMSSRLDLIAQSISTGAPEEIKNIYVYFMPYLEVVNKKKEAVSQTITATLKDITTALQVKVKSDNVLVPIREQSVISKGALIQEELEALSTPIISFIKPHGFYRNILLACECNSQECYICMAKEINRQKIELEKESMSVKLRSLYSLLEVLSTVISTGTSRTTLVSAEEFYRHRFIGTQENHILLAKIIHLGCAVLQVDPNINYQLATKLTEFTIKILNHSLGSASPAEYPLLITSLGLFYELLSFGFCGEEDDAQIDTLIDDLEDAGMRLGEGEKNISEKLKTEEEIGDDYKGEKDKQEQEIAEEDGLDCENNGTTQNTEGAEDRPDIELENGTVSEEEEDHNQKNKEGPQKKEPPTEDPETPEDQNEEGSKENLDSEADPNDEVSSTTTTGTSPDDQQPQEDPQEIDQEEQIDNQTPDQEEDSLNVQEMEKCENIEGEYNSEELEETDDQNNDLTEISLDQLDLNEEDNSSEEISVEHYESEEYSTNVKQYDFEELAVNQEQLFEEHNHSSSDMVGRETGEGAEKEIAVDKGNQIDSDAEEKDPDPEAEELYQGTYSDTSKTKDPKKVPFEKTIKFTNPVDYYNQIKHQTNPDLTQQLSIILEENEKSAYEGDYINGRRLNMKRIIPYIASDGQKNKIWMRKSKRQNRDYLIRIFVDNSGSIKNGGMTESLIKALTNITNSLDLLNVSFELAIFGGTVQHKKNMSELISSLTFDAQETRIEWITQKEYCSFGYNIIIGDGLFYDRYEPLKTISNTLLLIVDNSKIKEMRTVKNIMGELIINKYLDMLGLPYCIVDSTSLLEQMFCQELKNILLKSKQ
ncbi:midasin [Nematocida sp. AWRm80]|nr:midasin [Nematocida sp. AWRm80]